jgi:hypothetical protein
MPGNNRDTMQVEKDRALIAELYCKGYTQIQIAEILNSRPTNPKGYTVSRATIGQELSEIRRIWQESTLLNFNARVAEEMAKIDNLERMYHQAYEKSVEHLNSVQETVSGPEGDVLESDDEQKGAYKAVTKKSQSRPMEGNLKCLDGVLKCIETRCKLLGLFTTNIDIKTGGEKITSNVIVLPNNSLVEENDFSEERILQLMQSLGSQNSDI